MRLLLVLALTVLTGCSTLQRTLRADGMTDEERQAHREKVAFQEALEAQQMAELQARRDALKPGDPISAVVAAFGQPTKKEFNRNLTGYWYENDGDPIFFIFDNGALAVMQHDEETKRLRAEAADRRAAVRAQQIGAAAAAEAASAASTSNWINYMNANTLQKMQQQQTQPTYYPMGR